MSCSEWDALFCSLSSQQPVTPHLFLTASWPSLLLLLSPRFDLFRHEHNIAQRYLLMQAHSPFVDIPGCRVFSLLSGKTPSSCQDTLDSSFALVLGTTKHQQSRRRHLVDHCLHLLEQKLVPRSAHTPPPVRTVEHGAVSMLKTTVHP